MHAHTCIMDVRYDFTTRAATIAATQVTFAACTALCV